LSARAHAAQTTPQRRPPQRLPQRRRLRRCDGSALPCGVSPGEPALRIEAWEGLHDRSWRPRSGPRVAPRNPDNLLLVLAETEFCRGKELIDDVVVAANAIIDEIGTAALAHHEQRRCFTPIQRSRELDIDVPSVVEGAQRAPRRAITGNRVVEVQTRQRNTRIDWRYGLCLVILFLQG